MGIASQLGRSCAVAVGTLIVGGLLETVYVVALCPGAKAAAQLERHDAVVIDSGFRFAVAGEQIVACTTPHRLGPIFVHDDFDCYCVPASTDVRTLGLRVGGTCSVDKPVPRRTDEDGICRHAHCADVDLAGR